MKKFKNLKILMLFTLVFSIFSFMKPVSAAGSVTVGLDSDSTVALGDNITVTMYVSDISGASGGVESLEANLVFDSEYLEYVSGTGTTSPYRYQINVSNNYKIAGLDTYLDSGITSTTTVFTFVFKAIKTGTTDVTLSNLKVTDASSKLTASLSGKTITITDGSSTPAPGPTLSSDATLKSLAATGYTLSPSFSSATTSYTVEVPTDATTVTLTGAANDDNATVTGLGNVSLAGKTTTKEVVVTAEDGTKKTYTVTITKETNSSSSDPSPTPASVSESSDADLEEFDVSGYTLSPAFDPDTTSYTVKVPTSATTVTLVGKTSDTNAKVTGLGSLPLDDDTTTKEVVVTATDGTKKTYTITVIKEDVDNSDKDSDATLESLDIEGYTLSPVFKPSVNTYSMKVKNNVTSLDVDAVPASDSAKVTVSGNKNWKEGVNVVTIKVTAEDGTVNTYTVNVTRESSSTTGGTSTVSKSTDNTLKSLTINSSHEITPKFSKNVSSYNVTVPYSVDKLDLSYATNNSKAKVKVTGNSNFKVGEINVVEIEITAEDGSIRSYTLNVTRSTKESDNDLKEIKIDKTDLNPNFDPNTLEYSAKVSGNTDKLKISATPVSSESTVEIIGNDNLKEGHNTILIKVTDKNGFTKYYTIDVVKENESKTILGMSILHFGLFMGLFLLLLLLLLLLLFKKNKGNKTESATDIRNEKSMPIIEVKPEFNFGSKNTSDDDVVYGNMNQDSTVSGSVDAPQKENIRSIEAQYEEIEDKLPYDPYDEVVTKKEIIDAIKEARETRDASKLKMLLQQEELNQKKKEMQAKQEELNRREQTGRRSKDDDWR